MAIESPDKDLLDAYALLEGAQPEIAAYLKTHYQRYRTTLSFIGSGERLRILDLGPAFAFDALLSHRLPGSEIVLGCNNDPVSLQYFESLPGGRVELRSSRPDRFPHLSLPMHAFNAECDIWPFDSESFDLVLCMEMLEHLLMDPCFVFRECHRVLKPGGRFVATVPNIASMEGVVLILDNRAPYRYGPYSPHGPYGRHNREYAAREVRALGECSGFATEELTTYNVYPFPFPLDLARQALANIPHDDPSLRNQTIFYKGQKDGSPFRSYPEGLYEYDVPERNALLRALRTDGRAMRVEAVNTGRRGWGTETSLGIQLLDAQHNLRNADFLRVPLPCPVPPGGLAVLDFRVPDPGIGRFSVRLDMADAEGWFSAAPRGGTQFAELPGRSPKPLVLDLGG